MFIFFKKLQQLMLLFIILLTISCSTLYNATNIKNQEPLTVGLLSTKKESYQGEYYTAQRIIELINGIDSKIKVKLIDYNEIIGDDDKKSLNISSVFAKTKALIEENNIKKIIIPGNYYNISSAPFAPNNNRQLVTNAIVKIINENPKNINLLAICGGLQGIMKANGIDIIRVDQMLKQKNSIDTHIISYPIPSDIDAYLHKIQFDPHSRIGKAISKYAINSNSNIGNEWLVIYFPDAHQEAIANSLENMHKLYALGYKITGISEDGIIEALEDKHRNIYIQNHPEHFAMDADKKYNKNNAERFNLSLLAAIAVIKDFLYN